jgi:hypothetical protein
VLQYFGKIDAVLFLGIFPQKLYKNLRSFDCYCQGVYLYVEGHLSLLLDEELDCAEPDSDGEYDHFCDFEAHGQFAVQIKVVVEILFIRMFLVLPLFLEVIFLLVLNWKILPVISQ